MHTTQVSKTHDYSKPVWGRACHIITINDEGRSLRVCGHGHGIRQGDFILLANGDNKARYEIMTCSYYRDPDDMWRAELRFAPQFMTDEEIEAEAQEMREYRARIKAERQERLRMEADMQWRQRLQEDAEAIAKFILGAPDDRKELNKVKWKCFRCESSFGEKMVVKYDGEEAVLRISSNFASTPTVTVTYNGICKTVEEWKKEMQQ